MLSSDQTAIAFHLVRAGANLRFAQSGQVPPSDLAIMHLDTGRLDLVPGLMFPPDASAGLALDTTGDTVVAGVSLPRRRVG